LPVEEMDDSAARATAGVRHQVEFWEFFRSEYRSLLSAVMAVTASKEYAEDAIAEVIEEILVKDLWDGLRLPYFWIRRAAWRKYYDRCARERRGIELALEGGHLVVEFCDDKAFNIWEDGQWVKQMLDALPPAQRETMEHVLAEFTTAEMAEVLGKTPAAIRQNLALARRRLKPLLNDDYGLADTYDAARSTTGREDTK